MKKLLLIFVVIMLVVGCEKVEDDSAVYTIMGKNINEVENLWGSPDEIKTGAVGDIYVYNNKYEYGRVEVWKIEGLAGKIYIYPENLDFGDNGKEIVKGLGFSLSDYKANEVPLGVSYNEKNGESSILIYKSSEESDNVSGIVITNDYMSDRICENGV